MVSNLTTSELTERRARMAIAAIGAYEDSGLLADAHRRGAQVVWEDLITQDPERPASRFARRAHQVDLHAVEWGAASAASRWVIPGDDEWPEQLDALRHGAPMGLWIAGERLPKQELVVVTGSRASTKYGDTVAAEMAAGLAEAGWTVITGASYGVEEHATQGALVATHGVTVVSPSGIDNPYPGSRQSLFSVVRRRGTLVSEFPPGAIPRRQQFLRRNRIMAALSHGVVLVEAALRSGVHATAQQARDLSRPVMAIPGPVTSTASAGTNRAIQRGEATLVTDHRDVLRVLRKEEP